MTEAVWNNATDIRLKIERISKLIADVAATPFRWMLKPIQWAFCLILCIAFHVFISRDLRKKAKTSSNDIAEARRFIAAPVTTQVPMDALGKKYLKILRSGYQHWDSWLKAFEPVEQTARIPGWAVAPHRAVLKSILHKVNKFRDVLNGYAMLIDEIETHWPWFDEEKIKDARRRFADGGNVVALADIIADGRS